MGPASGQRVHRRRHAEPVLARGDRPLAFGGARAAHGRARRGDHARGEPGRGGGGALPRLSAMPGSTACRSACRASTSACSPRWAHPRPGRGAARDRGGLRQLRQRQHRSHVRPARSDARHGACGHRGGGARGVPHISAYQLTIEPNTVFWSRPPPLPAHDECADMQLEVESVLGEAGFEHYETSAFAKPGRRCQHNLNYWEFGDYLGIGAGAHGKVSFRDRITRHERVKQPREYLQLDDTLASQRTIPAARAAVRVHAQCAPAGGRLPAALVRGAHRACRSRRSTENWHEAEERGCSSETGSACGPPRAASASSTTCWRFFFPTEHQVAHRMAEAAAA